MAGYTNEGVRVVERGDDGPRYRSRYPDGGKNLKIRIYFLERVGFLAGVFGRAGTSG